MRWFNVQGDEAWAKLVGETILEFGNLELIVMVMLKLIPTDRIYESTKSIGLRQKINILEELLVARDVENSDVVKSLRIAATLVDQRNVVAHNPLGFDVYHQEENGPVFIEAIKSLKNENRKLYFKKLIELKDKIKNLNENMGEQVSNLIKNA